MKQKTNILVQFKQWILSVIIWRFLGLYCTCPKCKKGYIKKIDSYKHGTEMIIDIYKCSECGNREGINAL